jgi:alpha-methylacyl-CoA racemase
MPLRGFRVVTIAQNVPGPVAAAMLRDRGAAVVKVEPPSGDPLASANPSWYADLHRGVDVHRVDLKSEPGRARLEDWLGGADLLVTSSRPGAVARLGLGWAELHRRHPRLCLVSIVGYPAPREDVPGHDLTYQAEQGLVAPPNLPRTLVADLGGAQQVVIGAVSLLLARERGGEAGRSEVALADSARFFAEPVARGLTTEAGWLGGASAEYCLYRSSDGWIAVAALEPHFREKLARELAVDLNDRTAVAAVFRSKTAAAWQQWAAPRDLPIVAVR